MRIDRTICWTPRECEQAWDFLSVCSIIAIDVETIPFKKTNKHRAISMTVVQYTGLADGNRVESFAFPFQKSKSIKSGPPDHFGVIYQTCKRLNDLPCPKTGHNFIYDLAWFLRYHMPVRNWAFDSMIMWWAKYPELPKTLDFVSSILLDHYQFWKAGRKADDYTEYMHYGMTDTESTLFNTLKLIDMCLADKFMHNNFLHAWMRCLIGLSMSMKGLKVNPAKLEEFHAELKVEADAKLSHLRELIANPDFNPNSPKQKIDLIYRHLGATPRNAKARIVKKIEDASSGALALRSIRNEHPIYRRVINAVLNAIEPAKQISNVIGIEHMRAESSGEMRLVTSYDGVGTTTTRYSSRGSAFGFGTNNQNIRKVYRSFAEADADSVFFEIDLSAADDVFVSFESGDPKKIALFRSGKDIHASNALIFFSNWNYESIMRGKEEGDPRVVHPITGVRQITKKVVHGNHYLMAAHTLLNTAGRDAIVAAAKEQGHDDAGTWNQSKLVGYCEHMENLFRSHYTRFQRAGAESWYTELRQAAMESGGFLSIFNYFQRFLTSPNEDAVLRALAASAGQANTAGRINMALEELILGQRTLMFRDGPAPDADESALVVSEQLNGVSLRQQTHDSAGFSIRLTHPNWMEGARRVFHVFSRPVYCKGEVFRVGTEAEVSYRWAGKEGKVVTSAQGIQEFVEKFPRSLLTKFDEDLRLKKLRKAAASAASPT